MKYKLGFIGLGTMGRPMATNLLRAGHELTVYDVAREPVQQLVALGARAAATPRELGERCEIVHVAVWDDSGVKTVLLGDASDQGALAGAHPGAIVLLHSTISLSTCREVAAVARPRGVRVVDAAMSGGQPRAADGTLALMVGGDDEDVKRCWPVLEVLGRPIFHVGALGAGMAAKLCNNLMAMANIEIAAEAVRIAAAAGIEPARMIEVGAAGTGDSWGLRQGLALREAARNAPASASQLRMQAKDLLLAQQLGPDLGQDMPVARFFAERANRT